MIQSTTYLSLALRLNYSLT